MDLCFLLKVLEFLTELEINQYVKEIVIEKKSKSTLYGVDANMEPEPEGQWKRDSRLKDITE